MLITKNVSGYCNIRLIANFVRTKILTKTI